MLEDTHRVVLWFHPRIAEEYGYAELKTGDGLLVFNQVFHIYELDGKRVLAGNPQAGHYVGEVPQSAVKNAIWDRQAREENKRNFNTAALGIEEKGILRMAQVWARNASFEEVLAYARNTIDDVFQCRGRYLIYFYAYATDAFNDFLRQCFPDIGRLTTSIASNQEYDEFTEMLSRGNRNKIKIFSLRTGADRRPKTYEELTEEILRVIDDRVDLILVSSVTRYGDTPCGSSSGKSNIYYIEKMRKEIKKRYPKACFVIDGSQAVGRVGQSLGVLRSDAYIASGHKALGVGTVAFIAVSKSFVRLLPSDRKFREIASTKPKVNIAALAIRLRVGQQFGWDLSEFNSVGEGETFFLKEHLEEFQFSEDTEEKLRSEL